MTNYFINFISTTPSPRQTLPRLRILRRAGRSGRRWQVIPSHKIVSVFTFYFLPSLFLPMLLPTIIHSLRSPLFVLSATPSALSSFRSFQPNTIRLYIPCTKYYFQPFNNLTTQPLWLSGRSHDPLAESNLAMSITPNLQHAT